MVVSDTAIAAASIITPRKNKPQPSTAGRDAEDVNEEAIENLR